jgi:hypothetical protein
MLALATDEGVSIENVAESRPLIPVTPWNGCISLMASLPEGDGARFTLFRDRSIPVGALKSYTAFRARMLQGSAVRKMAERECNVPLED